MMNSSLENALKETWEMKEKFYEDTIGLTMIEIVEKIEGKEFNVKKEVFFETTVDKINAFSVCHPLRVTIY